MILYLMILLTSMFIGVNLSIFEHSQRKHPGLHEKLEKIYKNYFDSSREKENLPSCIYWKIFKRELNRQGQTPEEADAYLANLLELSRTENTGERFLSLGPGTNPLNFPETAVLMAQLRLRCLLELKQRKRRRRKRQDNLITLNLEGYFKCFSKKRPRIQSLLDTYKMRPFGLFNEEFFIKVDFLRFPNDFYKLEVASFNDLPEYQMPIFEYRLLWHPVTELIDSFECLIFETHNPLIKNTLTNQITKLEQFYSDDQKCYKIWINRHWNRPMESYKLNGTLFTLEDLICDYNRILKRIQSTDVISGVILFEGIELTWPRYYKTLSCLLYYSNELLKQMEKNIQEFSINKFNESNNLDHIKTSESKHFPLSDQENVSRNIKNNNYISSNSNFKLPENEEINKSKELNNKERFFLLNRQEDDILFGIKNHLKENEKNSPKSNLAFNLSFKNSENPESREMKLFHEDKKVNDDLTKTKKPSNNSEEIPFVKSDFLFTNRNLENEKINQEINKTKIALNNLDQFLLADDFLFQTPNVKKKILSSNSNSTSKKEDKNKLHPSSENTSELFPQFQYQPDLFKYLYNNEEDKNEFRIDNLILTTNIPYKELELEINDSKTFPELTTENSKINNHFDFDNKINTSLFLKSFSNDENDNLLNQLISTLDNEPIFKEIIYIYKFLQNHSYIQLSYEGIPIPVEIIKKFLTLFLKNMDKVWNLDDRMYALPELKDFLSLDQNQKKCFYLNGEPMKGKNIMKLILSEENEWIKFLANLKKNEKNFTNNRDQVFCEILNPFKKKREKLFKKSKKFKLTSNIHCKINKLKKYKKKRRHSRDSAEDNFTYLKEMSENSPDIFSEKNNYKLRTYNFNNNVLPLYEIEKEIEETPDKMVTFENNSLSSKSLRKVIDDFILPRWEFEKQIYTLDELKDQIYYLENVFSEESPGWLFEGNLRTLGDIKKQIQRLEKKRNHFFKDKRRTELKKVNKRNSFVDASYFGSLYYNFNGINATLSSINKILKTNPTPAVLFEGEPILTSPLRSILDGLFHQKSHKKYQIFQKKLDSSIPDFAQQFEFEKEKSSLRKILEKLNAKCNGMKEFEKKNVSGCELKKIISSILKTENNTIIDSKEIADLEKEIHTITHINNQTSFHFNGKFITLDKILTYLSRHSGEKVEFEGANMTSSEAQFIIDEFILPRWNFDNVLYSFEDLKALIENLKTNNDDKRFWNFDGKEKNLNEIENNMKTLEYFKNRLMSKEMKPDIYVNFNINGLSLQLKDLFIYLDTLPYYIKNISFENTTLDSSELKLTLLSLFKLKTESQGQNLTDIIREMKKGNTYYNFNDKKGTLYDLYNFPTKEFDNKVNFENIQLNGKLLKLLLNKLFHFNESELNDLLFEKLINPNNFLNFSSRKRNFKFKKFIRENHLEPDFSKKFYFNGEKLTLSQIFNVLPFDNREKVSLENNLISRDDLEIIIDILLTQNKGKADFYGSLEDLRKKPSSKSHRPLGKFFFEGKEMTLFQIQQHLDEIKKEEINFQNEIIDKNLLKLVLDKLFESEEKSTKLSEEEKVTPVLWENKENEILKNKTTTTTSITTSEMRVTPVLWENKENKPSTGPKIFTNEADNIKSHFNKINDLFTNISLINTSFISITTPNFIINNSIPSDKFKIESSTITTTKLTNEKFNLNGEFLTLDELKNKLKSKKNEIVKFEENLLPANVILELISEFENKPSSATQIFEPTTTIQIENEKRTHHPTLTTSFLSTKISDEEITKDTHQPEILKMTKPPMIEEKYNFNAENLTLNEIKNSLEQINKQQLVLFENNEIPANILLDIIKDFEENGYPTEEIEISPSTKTYSSSNVINTDVITKISITNIPLEDTGFFEFNGTYQSIESIKKKLEQNPKGNISFEGEIFDAKVLKEFIEKGFKDTSKVGSTSAVKSSEINFQQTTSTPIVYQELTTINNLTNELYEFNGVPTNLETILKKIGPTPKGNVSFEGEMFNAATLKKYIEKEIILKTTTEITTSEDNIGLKLYKFNGIRTPLEEIIKNLNPQDEKIVNFEGQNFQANKLREILLNDIENSTLSDENLFEFNGRKMNLEEISNQLGPNPEGNVTFEGETFKSKDLKDFLEKKIFSQKKNFENTTNFFLTNESNFDIKSSSKFVIVQENVTESIFHTTAIKENESFKMNDLKKIIQNKLYSSTLVYTTPKEVISKANEENLFEFNGTKTDLQTIYNLIGPNPEGNVTFEGEIFKSKDLKNILETEYLTILLNRITTPSEDNLFNFNGTEASIESILNLIGDNLQGNSSFEGEIFPTKEIKLILEKQKAKEENLGKTTLSLSSESSSIQSETPEEILYDFNGTLATREHILKLLGDDPKGNVSFEGENFPAKKLKESLELNVEESSENSGVQSTWNLNGRELTLNEFEKEIENLNRNLTSLNDTLYFNDNLITFGELKKTFRKIKEAYPEEYSTTKIFNSTTNAPTTIWKSSNVTENLELEKELLFNFNGTQGNYSTILDYLEKHPEGNIEFEGEIFNTKDLKEFILKKINEGKISTTITTQRDLEITSLSTPFAENTHIFEEAPTKQTTFLSEITPKNTNIHESTTYLIITENPEIENEENLLFDFNGNKANYSSIIEILGPNPKGNAIFEGEVFNAKDLKNFILKKINERKSSTPPSSSWNTMSEDIFISNVNTEEFNTRTPPFFLQSPKSLVTKTTIGLMESSFFNFEKTNELSTAHSLNESFSESLTTSLSSPTPFIQINMGTKKEPINLYQYPQTYTTTFGNISIQIEVKNISDNNIILTESPNENSSLLLLKHGNETFLFQPPIEENKTQSSFFDGIKNIFSKNKTVNIPKNNINILIGNNHSISLDPIPQTYQTTYGNFFIKMDISKNEHFSTPSISKFTTKSIENENFMEITSTLELGHGNISLFFTPPNEQFTTSTSILENFAAGLNNIFSNKTTSSTTPFPSNTNYDSHHFIEVHLKDDNKSYHLEPIPQIFQTDYKNLSVNIIITDQNTTNTPGLSEISKYPLTDISQPTFTDIPVKETTLLIEEVIKKFNNSKEIGPPEHITPYSTENIEGSGEGFEIPGMTIFSFPPTVPLFTLPLSTHASTLIPSVSRKYESSPMHNEKFTCSNEDISCMMHLWPCIEEMRTLALEFPIFDFLRTLDNFKCSKYIEITPEILLTDNTRDAVKEEMDRYNKTERHLRKRRNHRHQRFSEKNTSKTIRQVLSPNLIKLSDVDLFVLLGTQVSVPCFPRNREEEFADKDYDYHWTHQDGTPTTDSRFTTTSDGHLLISDVGLRDNGNYYCRVDFNKSGFSEPFHETFSHTLSVVKIPKSFEKSEQSYEPQVMCNKTDHSLWMNLVQPVINDRLCGKPNLCLLQLTDAKCNSTKETPLEFYVKFTVEISNVFIWIPTLKDICNLECQKRIELKFLTMLETNTNKIFQTPVFFRLTDHKRNFFPKHDLNLQIIQACTAGFFLKDQLCFPCPVETYSVEGSVSCNSCPRGWYQPEVAATACLPCPHPFAGPNCVFMYDERYNRTLYLIIFGIIAGVILLCFTLIYYSRKDYEMDVKRTPSRNRKPSRTKSGNHNFEEEPFLHSQKGQRRVFRNGPPEPPPMDF